MEFKKIGVLGGMGPEASANFYYKIIHYCQKEYQAVQDTDFPPMIINSLHLSGFNESGIVDENLVLQQLLDGVDMLNKAGCDFVVIPCNTVHYFIDKLRMKSSIPIVSIIEETVKKVKQNNHGIVGIIGSDTTLRLNIYQKKLNQEDITCISPNNDDFPTITKLILEIMGGKLNYKTKKKVISIIEEMKKKSTEALILGCTEIPLAINQEDVDFKVYDTLQILAEVAVNFAVIKD